MEKTLALSVQYILEQCYILEQQLPCYPGWFSESLLTFSEDVQITHCLRRFTTSGVSFLSELFQVELDLNKWYVY